MSTRFLIVESDPAAARELTHGLKRRGYDAVESVASVAAALGAARAQRPDLILMGSGETGAIDPGAAAAKLAADVGAPVIVLTTRDAATSGSRPPQGRPYRWLMLPFDDDVLHATIDLTLNEHRLDAARIDSAPLLHTAGAPFQALVESLPDVAVVLFDRDGRVHHANPATASIYGYDAVTLHGRTFATLLSANAAGPERAEDILACAAATGSLRTEGWHRRKDGTEFWAESLVTVLRNAEQSLIGFAGVFRDGTERRATAETLRQANAELTRQLATQATELETAAADSEAFTYSVAHDLRAPLRGISGYLDTLHEDHAGALSTTALDYLRRSIRCAHRMHVLIDELVKLSRIGRQTVQAEPTALRPLVEGVMADLTAETAGRNIEWRIGGLPTVACDPELIRTVILQLLANAVKFTGGQSHARIECDHETLEREHVVVVRDNGVGFDDQRAQELFTPFCRLHSAQEFPGNGIGLAIVARVVRRHGGRIWAESRPGQGATFYFTLPR